MGTNVKAYGFRSLRSDTGGTVGSHRQYPVANSYGTQLAAGDPIALSAGYAVRAALGDVVMGIAKEFQYVDNTLSPSLRIVRTLPASTSSSGAIPGSNILTPVVIVEDAQNATFSIVADSSVSADAMGKYATVSFGTADSYTGNSGGRLKVASICAIYNSVSAGVNSYIGMFQLLNLVNKADNNLGDATPEIEVAFVRTLLNQ